MTALTDPATLQIVTYPHPTLRWQSKPLRRVDAELRTTVRRMFELMYEAKGIGLAANQVDLPIRLFILNLAGAPDEGEEMVFINPVLSRPKGSDEAEEGCLSFPELNGLVTRPKRVHINAFGLDGRETDADIEGLFGRAAQHEIDHLDGVLFPDRMSAAGRMSIAPVLEEFEAVFHSRRKTGEIPEDAEIHERLLEWERRYC